MYIKTMGEVYLKNEDDLGIEGVYLFGSNNNSMLIDHSSSRGPMIL